MIEDAHKVQNNSCPLHAPAYAHMCACMWVYTDTYVCMHIRVCVHEVYGSQSCTNVLKLNSETALPKAFF